MKNLRLKSAGLIAVGAVGFATATLVGVALANSFTLQVAKNAPVTNGQTGKPEGNETIAVNSKRWAVYMLSGDSKSNPKCDFQGCWMFWPPLKVKSASGLSKAAGISGKLGIWSHNGFDQVTLSGHPLYRFHPDMQKNAATGDKIQSFGGTWHVVKASVAAGGMTQTGTTMSTGTTNTMPCIPYPGYPCL